MSALFISILFLGACTSQVHQSIINIAQINTLQLGQDIITEKKVFPNKTPKSSYKVEAQKQVFLVNSYNLILDYYTQTINIPLTSCGGVPNICNTRYTTSTITTPVLENFALIYKASADSTTLFNWGKVEELAKSEDPIVSDIISDLKLTIESQKKLSK